MVDSAHGAAYHIAGRPVLRAGCGRGAARHRAQRPQHQCRLRLQRARRCCARRCCARRPISGSRWTAMPTALVVVDDRGRHGRRRPAAGPDRGQLARRWPRCAAAGSWPRSCPTSAWSAISAAWASPLRRTRVGDRYVVEQMRADGYNVGGEQSGHIVLSDFATTGDGLLAALQVLAVLRQRDRPASEVAQVFAPVPQRLRNVKIAAARSIWPHPRRGDCWRARRRAERPWPAAGPRVGHRTGDPGDGRGRGRDAAERRAGQRQPRDRRARGLSSSQPEAAHLGTALRHSRIWTRESTAASGPCD